MKNILKATIVSILISASSAQAEEMAVIVNKANTVENMDERTIAKLFLAKEKSFGSAKKAKLFDHPKGTNSREIFYQSIVKRSENQMKSYWSKLIFTGKGKPPKELPNDQEIISEVAKTESAIAYVNGSSVNDSVKVVYRFAY